MNYENEFERISLCMCFVRITWFGISESSFTLLETISDYTKIIHRHLEGNY